MDDSDDLGPIDYLVVEFPVGTQRFSGSMARELASLVDAEMVRILDLLILEKGDDGSVQAYEIEDLGELDELRAIEATMAEILTADDVGHLAEAMEPGSVAGVLVWENTWAAPFGRAARESGGQLVASGRIPTQAVIATLQAAAAAEGA
jgi:hypothetical protein